MKNKQVYSLENLWRFQNKKQNKTPYFSKHRKKIQKSSRKMQIPFGVSIDEFRFIINGRIAADFSVEFGISLVKDARARMRCYYVKG
jgi:hypothetical protein